jgi:Fe-S-cluster containining protein
VLRLAFRDSGHTDVIPWGHVEFWRCYGCGHICCGSSVVPLTTGEWVKIVQNFGIEVTESDGRRLYLGKNVDNRCVFQYNQFGKQLCAIQHMKPRACKIWPFKIFYKPKKGNAEMAAYNYNGEQFYIYLDTHCPGIKVGKPNNFFRDAVIPEFLDIFLGYRERQSYTTLSLPERSRHYLSLRSHGVIRI